MTNPTLYITKFITPTSHLTKMASKLLLKHLKSLAAMPRGTTTIPRGTTSMPRGTTTTSNHHHHRRRLFSVAAPPPVSAAAPPPPVVKTAAETELEKVGNAKKVVKKSGSISEAEIAKFAALADKWWEVDGPHKALHALNPTRVAFIRSTLCRHFGRDPSSVRPFEGLKFADVGCGGGLLSEPLARLGATVTGIDAGEKNIQIARSHADLDPTTSSIDYICSTAEKLVEENRQFDAVLSLEVIEHVEEPSEFCKSLSALTSPGGAMVISTPNRTMRSYAAVIVAAEYILRWLPVGTHDWTKFITPEELTLILQANSISVQEIAGFVNDPMSGRWFISEDTGINYIVFGTKIDDAAKTEDPVL